MTEERGRTSRDVRRLVALFRPHRRGALLAAVAMLGVALCTALVAYLFGPLFDQVLTPEARVALTRQTEGGAAATSALKGAAKFKSGRHGA